MKSLLQLCGTLLFSSSLLAADAAYQSQLFKSLKLVYADTFDASTINPEFWEVRQNTT